MQHYRSSIPQAATERVVATFVTSAQKYKVECILDRKLVGIRFFHETGELSDERPLKNGVLHGIQYRSDLPGKILSAEPYVKGLRHGIAKQWSSNGKLLGTSRMEHGTGIDLWWQEHDEVVFLSEARYVRDGKWHGFDWWLNEDQKSVWQERHFWNNQMHGIQRLWNPAGKLRRGYPRYWVHDSLVTKRHYLRECEQDPALPGFHERDNRPQRKFPTEVSAHCMQSIL